MKDQIRILDAGCGIGRWTNELVKHFPDAEIIALDHKHRLPKIKGVKFIKGSIENLPFQDHEFDLVIASRVLPYVDLKEATKELRRVTKEKGVTVYELMQLGYYFEKLLKGSLKRVLNFMNLWFYINFQNKLIKRYDNIDTIFLTKYFSGAEIVENFSLKYWGGFPVYSLLFMNEQGKVYNKTLHNKIKKIAKEILNEET